MKFVVLGKYSTQGLAGFVKNPSDNRQEAAKKITEAAGGKLIDMMTLRGAYDFIAIIEGPDFETNGFEIWSFYNSDEIICSS